MISLPEISIQTPPTEIIKSTTKKSSFSESVASGLKTVCNITSKISDICYSLYDSSPIKACRIIGSPNMNITQCGPQCHVKGVDVKFTATVTCSAQEVGCWPGHGELGYPLGSFSGIFNAYILSVHQYGCKIKHNGSINPSNWQCRAAAEKLEHQEITIPYLQFGDSTIRTGNYRGSVQFLMAIECGKTTTIPASELRKKVTDLFCNIPTALPELIYRVCKDYWKKNSQQQASAITEQPVSASAARAPIINNINQNENREKIADSKEEVFWFGLTISPGDLNSAFTWGSESFSFSLQLTNYPRKNFMFTWKDGQFAPPANLAELVNIVTELCHSPGLIHAGIDEAIAQAGSAMRNISSDNAMREQAVFNMQELGQTLHEAIATRRTPKDASLPDLLAQATQAHSEITIDAEVSPIPLQEYDDEVMPLESRPRSQSQPRRRVRPVSDETDVKEMPGANADIRPRSSSLRIKDPYTSTEESHNKENLKPSPDEPYRPRSRTLDIRKYRPTSDHSD